MCVDPRRGALPSRTTFLGSFVAGSVFASAAFAVAGSSARADAASPVALPDPPTGMTPANARAAAIAASSPFVTATYARLHGLANSIADPELRANVAELLADPKPTFAARYASDESRRALLDVCIGAGFVAAGAPLATLFPANTDGNSAPQPFWSAAGSYNGSHHAYPGGLAVHECFNATMATEFASTYDATYFGGTQTIDRDIAIGAALYHDVMKTIVFQWNDDGSLFAEGTIGETGAHHVLSGAEAIARGRSPRFVIALLSAHAAPSLGDEAKVVTWCRAAALIAGVDPVTYGLLRHDGSHLRLAPDFVSIEAFVNHLSDHDYVLSVHAMQTVLPELARHGADRWYTNDVLAKRSAIALYGILSTGGRPAFDREVAAALRRS
jgi:hypothetical protein